MFYGHSHSYVTQIRHSLISLELCLVLYNIRESISQLPYMMPVLGSLCKKTRKVFINILNILGGNPHGVTGKSREMVGVFKGSEVVYERILAKVFPVSST